MIEKIIREKLLEALGCGVYFTEPAKPPREYVLIGRIGSSEGAARVINSVMLAVRSINADSIGGAMELNERVKRAMAALEADDRFTRVRCNSDSDLTDPETRRFGMQALFEITYYEEE